MSARSTRLVENLTRQPVSKVIANRRVTGRAALQTVPEGDHSPLSKANASVSHYSMSPSAEAQVFSVHPTSTSPLDGSEPDELVMTDSVTALRARMEAELIALRRAQSIFAESHPSVDVHGKLQDLQEMYIGDLLVKDCQIAQLRGQLETLLLDKGSSRSNVSTPTITAATPPAHSSMLAARVQSLQRSVSQERQRRMETECKLEDLQRQQETAADARAQLHRMSQTHRSEVSQLRTRITQLQDSNKRLQEQLQSAERKSATGTPAPTVHDGEQSPAHTTGCASPAGSVAAVGDKVAYVKYAALRAEKRRVEAKLNADLAALKLELETARTEKESELEKLKDHHRRVLADLERKSKAAHQVKSSEDGKGVKELKAQVAQLGIEKDRLQLHIDQLSLELKSKGAELDEVTESERFLARELEDREQELAKVSSRGEELERVLADKLELVKRVEEKEESLREVQEKLSVVSDMLAEKETEMATMITQAEELDSLLTRADEDVSSSRAKLAAAEAERDKYAAMVSAMSVNAQEEAKRALVEKEQIQQRLNAVVGEKERLTGKLESILAASSVVAGRKDSRLETAESKIGELERELELARDAIGMEESMIALPPNDASALGDAMESTQTPSVLDGVTENVSHAESMFHRAVELCSAQSCEFAQAVSLLQSAAHVLSQLSKEEIAANDPDTLRILESDIYGQLGVAFQSLSRVQEAVESYMTAVDVDPEAHACHANLAVLLHHQSRTKEAEAHANIAVKMAPDVDEYQELLGQIRQAHSISLSSPGTPSRKFRHSTRW